MSYKYFFNSVTIITFSVWPSPIFPCSFALQILSSCHHLRFSICIFFIPSLYLCPSLCYPYCLFIFSVSKTLSIPRMHKKAKRYQSLLPILSPLLLHAHSHLFTFVLQVLTETHWCHWSVYFNRLLVKTSRKASIKSSMPKKIFTSLTNINPGFGKWGGWSLSCQRLVRHWRNCFEPDWNFELFLHIN